VTDPPIKNDASESCSTGGGDQMTDEQFSELVMLCNEEFATKQQKFQIWIASSEKWFYDLEDCSLTIGNMQFRITPIGTYSKTSETWLWGWANPEFPPHAIEASSRLKSLYDITGWSVFENQGTNASSADAQVFSALALHVLDAVGLFKCGGEGEPMLYLAVHEQ
jgi:hypothetical protein